MSTIAVLGGGRVGSAIARLAVAAGREVRVADAVVPHSQIEAAVPGATAAEESQAVEEADIVVVAIPLHRYRTLHPGSLRNKIVVDVMNHWTAVDGSLPEFDEPRRGSSQIVAEFLPGARVVKTLNHIAYRDMEADARPMGAPDRRALAVASNDRAAAESTQKLVEDLGFDTVYAGPLQRGILFQPGSRIFNGKFTVGELQVELEDS